jgi:RNA 3'-terminal phosphate cyclase (ATP)
VISLDGSVGEGGGQILRTALSLSMITGVPFRIDKIRAKRRKPGLLRQHLTCVKAAAKISRAAIKGADLGALALTFEPGAIRGGTFDFAVGSAGSTCLVFQTVLPALLRADAPSHVTLSGGTHNPSAPTFDYLQHAFLPQLARMGAAVSITLDRYGFFPAGGGAWHADITPQPDLKPLLLDEAGATTRRRITASVANLPYDIALREAQLAAHLLSWPADAVDARTIKADGPGNVLAVEIQAADVTEQFTGFGTRGVSVEEVAKQTVDDVRAYLVAGAPVGPHLADQLLLPMALAGGGSFVTMTPTAHTRTNIAVIETFLPIEFAVTDIGEGRWRITVSA